MNSPEKYRFSPFRFLHPEEDDGMTRWVKSISLLATLLALLIFIDYFLPYNKDERSVKARVVRTDFKEYDYTSFKKTRSRHTGEEEYWLILDKEHLAISEEVIEKLKEGTVITIHKTKMFGINVKATCKEIDEDITPYFNVYGYLLIIPVLFILFFILIFLFGKKTELVLSLGVITLIMLVGYGVLLLFY